ncbi:MAG: hypothetical protein IPL75_00295 [Acidobacteria bacterium]|nr:hypothetical protein [Acidobacteriota bacterium]
MQHPQRSLNVYAEVLNDELCLCDRTRRTVHALNPSLARVWDMCDGQTSPADMAARLRVDLAPEVSADEADALVWSGLSQLGAAQLLQGELPPASAQAVWSRREVMKTGLIAGLVPVLISIVAPTPAAAQSAGTRIILYQANDGASFDGNLGGRAGADALCANSTNKPSGYTNYRAFISTSATDEIRDMPANYSVPTTLPITGPGPGFTQVASDWANLLDGGIDATLSAAGVSPGDQRWWSGSSSNGQLSSNHCIGWTTNSVDVGADGGNSTLTTSGWMNDFTVPCSVNNRRVLCIAY